MFRNITLIVSLAFMAGLSCSKGTGKNSPQNTLSEYVSRTFATKAPADKSRLLELTSGQAREMLDRLTDAEFQDSFVGHKREFLSLKIRDERKLGEDRYSITYELAYSDAGTESKGKVTNKKHALFVKEGEQWLISEVRNIKTSIEHQNEMSITP